MADLIISQPMTFTVDVKNGLVERPQRESLMRGDRMANRIIAELVDGSEPFDITGVTVKGKFCRPPNGDEIDLTGEAKANVAEVQLTDQCYTSGGHYEARVILVLGGVERTVLFISGDVLKSGSGNAAGDEETGGSGSTGSGLPAGGTTGQILAKKSDASFDAHWIDVPQGGSGSGNGTVTGVKIGDASYTPNASGVVDLSGMTAPNANQLNGKSADQYALKTDLPKAGDWDGNTVPNDIPDGISYVESGALTNGHGFPVGYCTVLSCKDNVNRLFQILVEKENGRMQIRSAKDGTTWGEWQPYLKATDTAADSAKLDGKDSVYYRKKFSHPRNLLDNSDFRNPVNQRGATNGNYSWEYIIDRWMVAPHAEGTVYVDIAGVDGAIGFSCESGQYYVFQRLPKTALKTDTAYTLAYKVHNGSIVTATYPLDDRGEYYQVTLGFDDVVYLEWATLYEGSYTADNLPPYVPKGYAAELAECLMYYYPYGSLKLLLTHNADGVDRGTFLFPTKMRIIPTLTYEITGDVDAQFTLEETTKQGFSCYANGVKGCVQIVNCIADADL